MNSPPPPSPTFEYFDWLLGAAPFERFVRDRHVNLYLQTIGGPVVRLDHSGGRPRRVLVVSGYEEERGTWATGYDDVVRVGDDVHAVPGIYRPVVLTPNFFAGRNREGRLVEYRFALIPGFHRLVVRPVVLRDSGEGVEAKVLPDACVVHEGVSVDAKSGTELSRLQLARVTTHRQFMACMWNVDDYLRKQNPAFDGEFPEVWRAVEAFSGRIVNQVLLLVAFHFRRSPEWFIPEAEREHARALVAKVLAGADARAGVRYNQQLVNVRNLNCYVAYFKNFWPLHELDAAGVSVVRHALDLFTSEASSDEVKCEAVVALFHVAKRLPHQLRGLVPAFEEILSGPAPRVENPLLYPLSVMMRRWPGDFSPRAVRTYLEFLFRTFFRFRRLEAYNYCNFFPDDVCDVVHEAVASVLGRWPEFAEPVRAAVVRYLAGSDRLLSRYAARLAKLAESAARRLAGATGTPPGGNTGGRPGNAKTWRRCLFLGRGN
ncbi:MAG: hypothetical protein Kow0069_14280 [Promethearchaeota archaeon]